MAEEAAAKRPLTRHRNPANTRVFQISMHLVARALPLKRYAMAAAPLFLIAGCLLLPPVATAAPTCLGKRATLSGSNGDDSIRGTPAPDVIVTLGGADRVYSFDGRDTICTGAGSDLVQSGPSHDRIDTGTGNDRVFAGDGRDFVMLARGDDWISGDEGRDAIAGGSGDDTIIGRNGGDTIRAGSGSDRILGGLLDDNLFGGSGNDVFLGGHGSDSISGGGGDDFMRGGVNYDHFYGGSGFDTVSFASATPPGPNGIGGVSISNNWMSGDDFNGEIRQSIERYLGSAFEDRFTASGEFVDICGGNPCPSVAGDAVALVDSRATEDTGLMVLGDTTNDDFTISQQGSSMIIRHSSPMKSGAGCVDQSATTITCALPPGATFGFIVASGGPGDDRIDLGDGIADEITVDIDAGTGDDAISGGPGDDVLIDEGGEDVQRGRGGADALISSAGADKLLAGGGSDQLVTDSLCYAHVFDGGPGMSDIAGFARVREMALSGGFGRGVVARGVSNCPRIAVRMNNEIFEGTNQGDIMFGTSRVDYIKSREGDDLLWGFGGADSLDGQEDFDRCYGGSGRDTFTSCEARN